MANGIKILPDRFTAEARLAFEKMRDHDDFSDVHVVVLAAVNDFLPIKSKELICCNTFEQFTDDKRLIEDLEFDSLAIAELVFFLEDLLAVSVSNSDLLQIHTIGELKEFIDHKLRSRERRLEQ